MQCLSARVFQDDPAVSKRFRRSGFFGLESKYPPPNGSALCSARHQRNAANGSAKACTAEVARGELRMVGGAFIELELSFEFALPGAGKA